MKLIFYMQINKFFYKLILSKLVNMASFVQNTRNNKSVQYLKKEIRGKVDFVRINLKVFKKLVLSYLIACLKYSK